MKKKKRKKLKKTLQPKAPLSIKEAEEKIKSIRAKLQDLKEYKAILAEDGLKPDEEDKRRESELIVRLLRLEKQAGITKEKEVPWRGKGGGKPGATKSADSKDSRSKDRDRRPSKESPARTNNKNRSSEKPERDNQAEGEASSRGTKKTINRGSKPSGGKKVNEKNGPRGPKRSPGTKKAGEKPARRTFGKKSKAKD